LFIEDATSRVYDNTKGYYNSKGEKQNQNDH
jgi:hypothetical protein